MKDRFEILCLSDKIRVCFRWCSDFEDIMLKSMRRARKGDRHNAINACICHRDIVRVLCLQLLVFSNEANVATYYE